MNSAAVTNQASIKILSIRRDVPVERKYLKIESNNVKTVQNPKVGFFSIATLSTLVLLSLNIFVLYQYFNVSNAGLMETATYEIPGSLLNLYE